MAAISAGTASGAPLSYSFRYQDGEAAPEFGLRIHQASVPEVSGNVYVYGTFQMCPINPIPYEDGLPQFFRQETAQLATTGTSTFEQELVREAETAQNEERPRHLQVVALGQQIGEKFTPAISFDLTDDGRSGEDRAFITPWANAGGLDYYSLYARPNTPYDFKLKLDLDNKRMSAWVSGRGDDDWFFLAEDVALTTEAGQVNTVQAEMYPGAPVIDNLMVRDRPWAPAERVQTHTLQMNGSAAEEFSAHSANAGSYNKPYG
jgi:hypothetical protein